MLSVHIAVLDGRGAHILFFFLILILIVLALVSAGWDPETGFAVVEGSILAGKIDTLGVALDVVTAALRECAGTGRELGIDGSVGGNPVGESVLAVLDDGLRCLISIIGSAGLAWGNWGIVNEL